MVFVTVDSDEFCIIPKAPLIPTLAAFGDIISSKVTKPWGARLNPRALGRAAKGVIHAIIGDTTSEQMFLSDILIGVQSVRKVSTLHLCAYVSIPHTTHLCSPDP